MSIFRYSKRSLLRRSQNKVHDRTFPNGARWLLLALFCRALIIMNYSDYFTGLSNVAEAIMLDTRIVFDGIDKASGTKRIITVFFYEAA